MPHDDGYRERVRGAVEASWVDFFERIGVRWLGEPRMGKAHGCPFHEDSHASFGITHGRIKGDIVWKCHSGHGCGHGDVFRAWQKARGGIGFRQALEELADIYHVSSDE